MAAASPADPAAVEALRAAQQELDAARAAEVRALDRRDAAIAAAHAGGMTIYRIAAVLGISQATARHALGLDRAKR